MVDDELMFGIERGDDHQLLITLRVYSQPTRPDPPPRWLRYPLGGLVNLGGGRRIPILSAHESLQFAVVRNEWLTGDPGPWDLELGPRYSTVRQALGDIKLRVNARVNPVHLEVDLWRKAFRMYLGRHFGFESNHASFRYGEAAVVGGVISADSTTGPVVVRDGAVIGGRTAEERLARGIQYLENPERRNEVEPVEAAETGCP